MVFKSKGKLFVISSPSGGGKSTVIRMLRKSDPKLGYSVSATTRPPRRGEKHGVDYFFMNKKAFEKMIHDQAFFEWAEVHGQLYGTLRDQIVKQFEEGKKILLDVDVQGGLNLKREKPDAVLIFLLPPSIEVLKSRLIKRSTENLDELTDRLDRAKIELGFADFYDYQIINDRLKETVQELNAIIQKVN